MTQSLDFMGNRVVTSVIPAACLSLLTLGSVSVRGYPDFSLLPGVLIIITVAFTLIIISLKTPS